MILSFLLLSLFFLLNLDSLIMALLTLELLSFILFYMTSIFLSASLVSSSYLIVLFSVFVMGGVLGLSSLVVLVSFTGLDYLSATSMLKF